jgi:hypothetical protein
VHFCAALFVSAAISAPWKSLQGAGLAVAACGISGAIYIIAVGRRARSQTGYKPVLEDWLWHVALPFVAYATLLAAGLILPRLIVPSSFGIASMTLLLVYIGIHNSWDTIVYVTLHHIKRPDI